jgi:hypothetical protein
MAQTFGEIRGRAAQLPHGAGVAEDVLNGYINDRAAGIVRAHTWSRLKEQDKVLTTVAVYETGTVLFTNGSASITGTDTVWTAAMTGRRIRNVVDDAWYIFTYVSATSGTIDRAYEGDTDTEATYKIFQPVYTLATDVGVLESVKGTNPGRDLDPTDREDFDRMDAARSEFGTPSQYSQYEDSSGTQQIELDPIPEAVESFYYRYKPVVARLSATSDTFPDWLPMECLFAGLEADLLNLAEKVSAADRKEARFRVLLNIAIIEDLQREPSVAIRMASRMTEHRQTRALGMDGNRLRRLDQM